MDLEKRMKRESIRIIVSEIIMVVTVAIMVVILAFLVSGYWLGSGFTVERQGMLQISSIPTGASVAVDGDSPWFQRTNTSKVLASGEHEIILTKDGYDSWSKTVNIREGLLYRLHYPRLFLQNRELETVGTYATATFGTVSPNRKWLILANNTMSWTLINLDRDQLTPTELDVSGLLGDAGTSATSVFSGEITYTDWAGDNEHLLLSVKSGDTTDWILLNIRNVSDSVNITKEISTGLSNPEFYDNSASIMLAIRGGDLYRLEISSRKLSAPLAKSVSQYSIYDGEIIFVSELTDLASMSTDNASNSDTDTGSIDAEASASEITEITDSVADSSTAKYAVNLLRFGDTAPTKIDSATTAPRAYISKFYDDKYIILVKDATISVHQKDTYEEVYSGSLGFTPTNIKIGHDGEFVFMADGTNFATLDMESYTLTEWTAGTEHYGWIDSDMLYAVSGGELNVYDYDSLNRRTLSSNVSDHFPVTITANKWLYYFSDDHLVREWLIKR